VHSCEVEGVVESGGLMLEAGLVVVSLVVVVRRLVRVIVIGRCVVREPGIVGVVKVIGKSSA